MRTLIVILLVSISFSVQAQQTSTPYYKFGKITVEDLQRKKYAVDSSADAVVLCDVGETVVEGNNKSWFSARFKRHRVIHILNKNGYDQAKMTIRLYTRDGDEEKLDNLKAVTYNLENGKIVETKLEKSEVFKEKVSEYVTARKFTMPAVREGSIVEIQYTTISDFIQILDPWEFQGTAPTLWSEYNLSVPQFFTYSFLSHGYHAMYINDRKNRVENFTIRDTRSAGATSTEQFQSGVTDFRWVMKDVPAIKEESFSSAMKNHLSSIEFQMISHNPPLQPRNFRESWTKLTSELLEAEYFGKNLSANNMWLLDEVKPVIAGAGNEVEKARRIYSYVRDNFSCNNSEGISLSQSLKNVYKGKKGGIADINLLLTAMLKLADLNAEPVLVSTTDHGYVMDMAPMITSFNYVVTKLEIGGNEVYLDASRPGLGFGRLPMECYNGIAKVVNPEATSVNLKADNVKETKLTSVFIINDKGKLSGAVNQTKGYFESLDARKEIKTKGQEAFFEQVAKGIGGEIKLKEGRIDSINRYDDPVSLHYEIELPAFSEEIVYFNPMFGEGYEHNPFKSAQRYYPVEMPYTSDETFSFTMEVPEGYVVDELPKQLAAKLDENASAYFEYRISLSGSTISMRTRLKIDKTLFLPDEYDSLREFFNMVVSKQNEQIVFKKKK